MSAMRTRKPSMVDKSLALIDVLGRSQKPLGVAEIAELLGVARTSIYRLIAPLDERGYVRKVEGARYSLSLKFIELAEIVREGLELRRIAYPVMERLRDRTELAVHLVVRDGDQAVYVEKVESNRPVRLYTRVGRRVPLHVAACPRLLLAYCTDEEVAAYLRCASLVKFTPNTVADVDQIWRLIREVRRTGFSTGYGELEPETAAVAVPVRDHTREVVAALSLAGPEWHFRNEDLSELVKCSREAAAEISAEMGFRARLDSNEGGVWAQSH